MKRMIKNFIVSTTRDFGYDLVRSQRNYYSIFTEDRAIIANVTHQNQEFKFFIGNPNDIIQKIHLKGSLYETEELAIIERNYVQGATFVDIGANVGNHALWAAKCLCAPRVIAFEPVLGQHTLLCANIALNELCDRIQVRKTALSSKTGSIHIPRSFLVSNNSGAARVSSTGLGEEVRMSTGDLELADTGSLFIKIDVEGHEISVLHGLRETVKMHRPKMFIEVDSQNEVQFDLWLKENCYKKHDGFKRYEQNCNYLVVSED